MWIVSIFGEGGEGCGQSQQQGGELTGGDEGGATPAVCDADARSGGTVQALRAMVEEAKAELASARREMETLISERRDRDDEVRGD